MCALWVCMLWGAVGDTQTVGAAVWVQVQLQEQFGNEAPEPRNPLSTGSEAEVPAPPPRV